MYELTICTKEGRELRRYELSGTRPIRIGRGIDCDIQIGVPEVSRRHAQLEFDDDEWIIKDLNSTHGVLIEGQRVREATIEPGLEVTIGPAILRFENMAARIGGEINRMLGDDDEDEEEGSETSPIDPHAHAETTHSATAELQTAGAPVKKKSLLGFLSRKKK
jgi:pSer/pThr/pTyr-binding forkhead associated (FHA) protein